MTAREAKKIAGKSTSSSSGIEWKEKNISIAKKLLRDKFVRSKELKSVLMKTGHRNILYTPEFSDNFWGLDKNEKGQCF